MILADAAITNFSPPMEIGVWLACACFAMWAFLLVVKMIKVMRGKPTVGDIRDEAAEKYPTRGECEKQHSSVSVILLRHEKEIENLWKTIRDEHTKIRKEITSQVQETERRLTDKIEEQPSALFAMLRNAKARFDH